MTDVFSNDEQQPEQQPAPNIEQAIAGLSRMLEIPITGDEQHQFAGATVADMKSAVAAIREMIADIEDLRSALEPFAEVARRMGWDQLHQDDPELNEHIIEAPAPEVGADAAYCLMVSAFWWASWVLADNWVPLNRPAGSTFATLNTKRWWRR